MPDVDQVDQLERRFVPGRPPTLVFLHEGLGSIELWRDFPDAVRGDHAMLIYSRAGYGRSPVVTERRRPDYMHHEALAVLPAMAMALFDDGRPILIGHSDGASIAIIHTGAGHAVAGLVLIAPHVFVEDESIKGIEAARETFLTTDLPQKMARYHRDAGSTFWGWNDIWLSSEFRQWNIEEYLPGIDVPVLLMQGDADEYGTLAQLDAIEGAVKGPVTRVVIEGAGHAPHLQRPAAAQGAVRDWLAQTSFASSIS